MKTKWRPRPQQIHNAAERGAAGSGSGGKKKERDWLIVVLS